LVNGDLYAEYDEYFLVNLTNPTGAPLGNSQAWSPILNDDGVFVSIGDSSVQEPHDGETTYIGFDVWLSAPFAETVTVYFYTSDGSATADYDYVPAYGMLTFAPGETHQTIWVQVLADAEWEEGNEQFYVSLSGTSSNALIDRGWGTGAIWD
jgi:hypothetical protein